MKIIKLTASAKARFSSNVAKRASEMYGTKITVPEVLNELLAYEMGVEPLNEPLGIFVRGELEQAIQL